MIWCFSLAEFSGALLILNVVGKNGPVIVNSGAVAHNPHFEDDPEVILTVGQEGKPIDLLDIKRAYIDLDRRGAKYFNSGRSYAFEGQSKDEKGVIHFVWGS